jgi:hypothetical protein
MNYYNFSTVPIPSNSNPFDNVADVIAQRAALDVIVGLSSVCAHFTCIYKLRGEFMRLTGCIDGTLLIELIEFRAYFVQVITQLVRIKISLDFA